MTRHLALRAFTFLALLLLAVTASSLPLTPAVAEDGYKLDDIRRYIIPGGSNNIDAPTSTTLEMWHRGDTVELRGPITVLVYVWSNDRPDTVSNTVTIKDTMMIGNDEYSDTHPGDWNVKITLLKVDISSEIGLYELIEGEMAQQIGNFYTQRATNIAQAGDAMSAAIDGFKNTIREAGGGTDFPNLDEAARTFGTIAFLAALKDSAGEPVFKSLRSQGIQKVLTRMALGEAADTKKQGSLGLLTAMLTTMDMTTKAKGTPGA
jgi:hypothetical protein